MKFYKNIIAFLFSILIFRTGLAESTQPQILNVGKEIQPKGESASIVDQNDRQLSEYMGYLMWESLQEKDFHYDLEHVIQGLRSAEKGDFTDLSKEKYRALLIENEKQVFEKKSQKNLSQANDFLKKIKHEGNIKELEKDKLYFKKIMSGNEISINENDSGLFHIKCYTLDDEIITNTYAHEKPTVQNLQNAIPGFKRGASGMSEGEKRILYIHPDLGYGIFRNFEPNVLLITEVELIKIIKK
jgi:peptidylprolyl isomerase